MSLKKGKPGTYTFGELDHAQYTGEITYTDVDSSKGYWMFHPTGYSIAGKAGSANSTAMTAIVDTGTTVMMVDNAVARDYWSKVPSAGYSALFGGYDFSCSEKLPDFSININGYSATVPGSYFIIGKIFAGDGPNICLGGLQPRGDVQFDVYGDVFLKSQFVVFDQTQAIPRLGFASQA